MRFATTAAMRRIEELEHAKGVEYYEMMREAGECAAGLLCERFDFAGQKVTVLCGRGNNGGDGLVVAAYLHGHGAQVTVALVKGGPATQPAALALGDLPRDIPIVTLPVRSLSGLFSVDFIIDAIYGIGFAGEPSDEDIQLFCLCRDSAAVKISLDLPSGMEGDSGRFTDCFMADITIAMGVYKPAHLVSWHEDFCGELLLAQTALTRTAEESGLLLQSLTGELCALPMRQPWSHKGDNGRLAVVCGSRRFTGAAAIACAGALRAGAGYVHLLSTAQVCGTVAHYCPEVIFTVLPDNEAGGIDSIAAEQIVDVINRSDAALVGCGMGDSADTAAIVRAVLGGSVKPLLLDADGINGLSGDISLLQNTHCHVVLTPHPGEFSRLAKKHIMETKGDATLAAARVSAETGATLLLKGAVTGIFRGMQQPVFSFMGNDSLAKGGSGDLLSGITASLMAQRLAPGAAVLCGAWLHGRSAELASAELNRRWLQPSDLTDYLSFALDELER